MKRLHNPTLLERSRALRTNMTPQEKHLWYDFLRQLKRDKLFFQRQKVIGNYIVDFFCASVNLVIELDGSQHYEDDARRADMERDAFLRSQGLTVLRYTNLDVDTNFKGVCADIAKYL